LDRQVSLAVLAAVLLETAAGLVWAGRAAARIDEIEAKVAAQAPVAERLARLEAYAAAQGAQLGRIEGKLDGLEGR
jgi:uncharacterized coiled-coil protein SlyX